MFDDRGIEKVRGVSFEVRAGEIVGIAGVDGNGQTRADRRAHGPAAAGVGHGRGRRQRRTPRRRPRTMTDEAGVGHIPEDRHLRGLVLDFSLAENLALHDYRHAPDSRFGWLFPSRLLDLRPAAAAGVRRARRRPVDARRARSRAATSRRSCSRARSSATRAS